MYYIAIHILCDTRYYNTDSSLNVFLCHVLGAAGFLHHNQSWCFGNCTDENNGESGLPDDHSGKYDAQVCCGMYYNTRAKYHQAVKLHKSNELDMRRSAIANAASKNNCRNLWQEIKKLESGKHQISCSVEGSSDDMEIAGIFADNYRNLYSSVPTSAHEITDLRNELHTEIINADPSEHAAVLTVMDVCKSLSMLKHEKSDGLRGTDSDHFIYSSQLFKIYITLMVNSMFTHGYTPSSLLESVINSIPKDLRGDMCNKDNYRGIALCSALCKLVDILIIEKHGDVLFTSELQFAFKPRHSTNMCTAVLKEVCSYYNCNNTDVYLCTLDASKAFDRVHYGKLFSLLRDRKLPAVVVRLLLDMYTRQRMCTTWNGTLSEFFYTQNAVKQGGILSPVLFCVYVDELLNRVNGSGIGCHVGHLSYAGLGYADDVALLTPSIQALQELLHTCEDFADEYNVKFNAKKTMCMCIGSSVHLPRRRVTLHGSHIAWSASVKHLGNNITQNLSDSDDIRAKKGVFISQVNKLNNKFSVISSNVRGRLLQTYCCSWYGCQTWDLDSKQARQMNTEWNKAIRRTLKIPYTTHRQLLPLIVHGRSFADQHVARVYKFMQSFVKSPNQHVLFIGEKARQCTNGALGRNWAMCVASRGPVPHRVSPDSAVHANANCICELLDVRDRLAEIPGFNVADVNMIISDICCT